MWIRLRRRRKWKIALYVALIVLELLLFGMLWRGIVTNRRYKEQIAELSECNAETEQTVLAEIESAGREVFLSSVSVGEFLQEGDCIDVRISYQTGEDYVVLSDKELLLCESTGIVLSLSEREIELLSSAMTDVKRYPETELYAVRYPDAGAMDESRIFYLPNEDVARLIGWNEKEVQSRKKLEERLNGEK